MKALSRYEIVSNTPGSTLIIRDVGHENHRSVTNDAENVVADLSLLGWLPPGRRLFYYDSQGQLDELLVRNGKFAGFKAGPRAAAERLGNTAKVVQFNYVQDESMVVRIKEG